VTEIFARLYTRTFNLPVVPLRFFNVYGPRQRPDSHYAAAVPIFIRRVLDNRSITIFGDGKQTRDFIFVGDVVDALLRAVASDAAGEPFNVCSGRETTSIWWSNYAGSRNTRPRSSLKRRVQAIFTGRLAVPKKPRQRSTSTPKHLWQTG
jgi:hypothetical protein